MAVQKSAWSRKEKKAAVKVLRRDAKMALRAGQE